MTSPEAPLPGSFWQRLTRSPRQMWKSRINWRIAISVFTTILLVQALTLVFTLRNAEGEKIAEMRDTTKILIGTSISETREPPMPASRADRLLAETDITGIAIYDLRQNVLKNFGVFPSLKPGGVSSRYSRPEDADYFEAVFLPSELGKPYQAAVRISTADVRPTLVRHVQQSVATMLFLSFVVTLVLMWALGKWLLEPVMMLRANLLSAAQNPEDPDIKRAGKETRDEIGIVVRIANDLIRQNAHNLKRLRSQAEDRIHKLAYYDALTGLPNRTFFIEKLEGTIRQKVGEEDLRLAVFSIDIDHFKDINDTMGHEFGDKLLEAVSKRLVKALPEDTLISRASADEFTVMAVLRHDRPDSALLVDAVFNAMTAPVSIMQERFQVRVSIGVSHCPDDGMDARQILKNADIALNRAKEEGRDTVRYYSEDFDRVVQQRFQLLRDLRTAIDQNQLQLHYHPQFDLKSGALIGAEALLRWWRPDNSKEGGAFIPPAEFIPVAEQSGLIVPISEWVLKTACVANKGWQNLGLPSFRIAVNISGVQFHRSDVVRQVASALKESGLDPRYLELEVTESVFMENVQTAIDILNQLHRQGVEIAVDDFGTGYSSLSYLRQFPIDRLKIDQSFVRNALTNPDDRMIAKTIISLGHSLNLKVIAEGVETMEHENFLRQEGCDEVQGFKYTRPIPADKFREYVTEYNRALAKNTKLSVVDDKA